uniref:LPS-assembly lipoprotein LptE n=1 Tax=Candidatus Kentrum sp. TC TaxID=2126339 RepID=A0A451AGD1_9GAMM|nr:MAG: LPS-assembly lipoprotein [Candidatus Kentron sp. TC]VFK52635.1 MAG: LPS-assembly lipoprotein [Candidatus Kentron sp. TC]VFK65082.1 MAG: LPS-assembly lipoprotein [Candidatus Kentron sp. TC]
MLFSSRFTFIMVFFLLTGCGFHLRGSFVLPNGISSLYIQAPMHLANELAVLLESNGIIVASASNDADAILRVEREAYDKRTLSVDSDSGKEREHELVYVIFYRVLKSNGEELIPQQTVNLVRDYVFDEDAVLGTSQEEGILYQEMREDAAWQILRRLAAWSL